MSTPAIRVENLGKRYRLGETHSGSIRELVNRGVRRIFGRKESPVPHTGKSGSKGAHSNGPSEFWALDNVSFSVPTGDVVGVIGRNGAGKSTLLKVLSGITSPTSGSVRINGRVASLLEVGTGFHPELTGRENVFLNGAILGMTRAEVRAKFDEIVAFSEIEQFIDTPVKRYSSGMYVRLAFAVAAHLDPEILVIDEVLAVGDGAFQEKCLGKMGTFAGTGRTVLFVSHNLHALRALCQNAVVLDHGTVAFQGPAHTAIDRYQGLFSNSRDSLIRQWTAPDGLAASRHVLPHQIRVSTPAHPDAMAFARNDDILVEISATNLVENAKLIANLALYTSDAIMVFDALSSHEAQWRGKHLPAGRFRFRCTIPGRLLNEGHYRLRLAFLDENSRVLFDCHDALAFSVEQSIDRGIQYFGKWQGVIRPDLSWAVDTITH